MRTSQGTPWALPSGLKPAGSKRLRPRVSRREGHARIPWTEWRSLAKAIARLSAGLSAYAWWRKQKTPPVAFPLRRWRSVRAERLRRIQQLDSTIAARCECGHAQNLHEGAGGKKVEFFDNQGKRDWRIVESESGTCEGCDCVGFHESRDQYPLREPGDDTSLAAADLLDDLVDERQVGDGARKWTHAPPAWTSMTPLEDKRLRSSRNRAMECRTGKALELEHLPCGNKWWVRFGCRTRLCESCGARYRGLKRDRFEPLARLHVDDVPEAPHPWNPGGSSDMLFQQTDRLEPSPVDAGSSTLKFLTLTFPDNVFVGPAPEGHVAGPGEIRWETPNDCREWFRAWTKKLRHFIGPFKVGKKQPSAPSHWGVRGYLAVWEVTAEKICGECGLGRSAHDKLPNGAPGPGRQTGRTKCACKASPGLGRLDDCGTPGCKGGKLVRANDCTGWKNEKRSGRFHPHLHLLVWSRYIPIADLRTRWTAIGGGGQIRLEAAEGPDAVDYILKYLGKPWAGVPDDLQVVGLYRMRRVTSCGMFYGKTFTDLTAALLEPCEKTRAGIFCPACRSVAESVHNDTSLEAVHDGTGSGAFTPAGVEIADLRTLGKPEKRPPEWRTVRLRMLHDIPDFRAIEPNKDPVVLAPAGFAVFAWNGLLLSLLSEKLSAKVFELPKATSEMLAAHEVAQADRTRPGPDVPF